jgi:osmoprotectant transport system permease protein
MNPVFQFITNPANNFSGQTIAFLQICAFSIVVAVIIGMILGILVARNALLAFIAVNISGLMRAIPVLAFLIAALPFLGLGFKPTVVALIILGIPPILLNTYTSLRDIDPAIIDAARGMGMTGWQIIARVQVPLVIPIVAAGIRTSAVQIIATAPLAALIGAGGYGDYIIDGLYKLNNVEILAGVLPIALLALIVEVLMSRLQLLVTPAGLRQETFVPVAN